jgi:hypothetical protein
MNFYRLILNLLFVAVVLLVAGRTRPHSLAALVLG